MADLRANERKILSVLQKLSGNASVEQLISEAKLSDAAVMRAALTLQEKNLTLKMACQKGACSTL
jgi:hypothetical protein